MDDDEKHLPDLSAQGLRQDRRVRVGIGAALALLGLWFVVQNSHTANVRLFFWQIDVPLIFVLIAMVLLGVVLDRLWLWRRRRSREGD